MEKISNIVFLRFLFFFFAQKIRPCTYMYILGYNNWSFDAKERLKSASTIEHPTLLLVKRYTFFDNRDMLLSD